MKYSSRVMIHYIYYHHHHYYNHYRYLSKNNENCKQMIVTSIARLPEYPGIQPNT